jgi:hypothetical protein
VNSNVRAQELHGADHGIVSKYPRVVLLRPDRQPIGSLAFPTIAQAERCASGYHEHGYAASVILLLVAMFESYVVRVRYIQRPGVPATLRSAIDVLLYLYPKLRHRKALTDVYVARDAIFHNHLWEIEYSWGGSPSMMLYGAVKDPAFGDKKYLARVNPTTRRTKALGISIVPTRVDRRDVKKVCPGCASAADLDSPEVQGFGARFWARAQAT